MTAPDSGIEEVLRRALAEAVSQVEPGTDALERIRARIGQRRPRPWLVSVAADALGRARHWTWRGHWAWQATMPALTALRWPRLRRLPHPDAALLPAPARRARVVRLDTVNWLRPVAVLAGIGIIASVSFGVQPFRQAIIAASTTVLSGGQTQSGGADTDGSGTPTGDVASSPHPSTAATSTYASPTSRGPIASSSAASSASAAPSAACPASLMEHWSSLLVDPRASTAGTATSAKPNTAAGVVPSTLPSPTATSTPSPSCAATASPAASPSATPSVSVSATPTTTGSGSGTATPSGGMSPTAPPTGSGSGTPTPTDSGIDTSDGGAPISATATPTSS